MEIEHFLHEFEEKSADNTTRRSSGGDHVGGPFHSELRTYAVTGFIQRYNHDRARRSSD